MARSNITAMNLIRLIIAFGQTVPQFLDTICSLAAVVLTFVQQDGTDDTFLIADWAFDGTSSPLLERLIGN